MIRKASSLDSSSEAVSSESMRQMRTDTALSQDVLAVSESRESEISRLTWAVLDGSASEQDRERLADLVGAQHEKRQR